MIFCSQCGAQLNEGTKFCGKCGTRVVSAAAPQPEPVQQGQASMLGQGTYQQMAPAKAPSPFGYFIGAFQQYVVFEGRARRAEFWWFVLFYTITSFIIGFLDGFFDLMLTDTLGGLSLLWLIATFLPSLSLMVRRMHDCDKAGPFLLIPIYGWIVLPLTGGTKGPNRFGPDPKQGY